MGTDDMLARHSELLVALNETADRHTAQLDAIVEQLRRMNDGIIRALTDAAGAATDRAIETARLEVLEARVEALERRR